MRSFAIATLLAAACAVNAANTVVTVGKGGNVFSPTNFNANIGDTITFQFVSAVTHTVTQSTLANPCKQPSGAFDSGDFTNGSSSNPPTFVHTITTLPIYYHCEIHCEDGMVGAVNVSSSDFTIFQDAAKAGTTVSVSGTSAGSSSPSAAKGGTSASSTATGSLASGNSTATGSSASGTSAATATASSAARQVGGGSALGAAMAILVGLAL